VKGAAIPGLAVAAMPESVADVLSQGIRAVFSRWTTLRLAVERGGSRDGHAIADELLADVIVLATSTKRRASVDDYSLLMEDAFERLQTAVEDGSPQEVAQIVLNMRDAAAAGDVAPARFQILKPVLNTTGESVRPDGQSETDSSSDSDDDDDDDDGMAEVPRKKNGPVIDEEGFEKVIKPRRVGRART
jgi:Pre-rRNA-processing protein TSR2